MNEGRPKGPGLFGVSGLASEQNDEAEWRVQSYPESIQIDAEEYWSHQFRHVRAELASARARNAYTEMLVQALKSRKASSQVAVSEGTDGNPFSGEIMPKLDVLRQVLQELEDERREAQAMAQKGADGICATLGIDASLSAAAKWEAIAILHGRGLLETMLRASPKRPRGKPPVPAENSTPVLRAQIINFVRERSRSKGANLRQKEIISTLHAWSLGIPRDQRDYVAILFSNSSLQSIEKSVSTGHALIREHGLSELPLVEE